MTHSGRPVGSPTHRPRRGALWDLLIVVACIGVLMSLAGPRVLNYLGESKVKTAKMQIQGFASALRLFHEDVGRYPSTSEGLAALVKPTGASWKGPYLAGGNVPNDPWGKPYIYRSPGAKSDYEISEQPGELAPDVFD